MIAPDRISDKIVSPRKDSLAATLAAMDQRVQRYRQHYLSLWWDTPTTLPAVERPYSQREQAIKEEALKRFLSLGLSELEQAVTSSDSTRDWEARIRAAAEVFGRDTLELDAHEMGVLLDEDVSQAAARFVQAARVFDPAISPEDIIQASRNAWTISSLQILLGRPVELTPSAIAYSLLYPYTDNYLDDPNIPNATKATFNRKLERALWGEEVEAASAQERAMLDLVDMIASQYSRGGYPGVWASLLTIHRAQVRSLALHGASPSPYEVDVLGLSLEKGGTSVLADGYLAAGTLTEEQERLLFGYGAVLQIVDDLQDVQEDRARGHLTVFAQSAPTWRLDGLTNRTLGFALRVAEKTPSALRAHPLQTLMARSCALLVFEAVARHQRLFTRPYVADLQRHSPFRFAFLRAVRRRLRREHASLARLVEQYAAM